VETLKGKPRVTDITHVRGARLELVPKTDAGREAQNGARTLTMRNGNLVTLPVPGLGQGGYQRELTAREVEILQYLCQGYANLELAQALGLSVKTIEGHIASIYTKLGVRRRSQAVALAIRHGLDQSVTDSTG
jgi:DNA-binding CsgD family transcriptional regulator